MKYFGVVAIILSMWISILGNSYIGIGVTGVLALFSIYALKKGYSLEEVNKKAYDSGKKSFLVIKIFFLVGMISSIWIMSGTIPGIVYYGIKFMNPKYFYLSSFVITSIVSFLLGSSLGTAGTVGIAMAAIGRGLGADMAIVGGTVISGAYFGDRCSPVSSSASLVATLSETNLYTNIRNMFKTGSFPFLMTCLLFMFWSVDGEIVKGVTLVDEIEKNFVLSPWIFLPVIIILVSTIFRINVKISMGISIVGAIIVAYTVQNYKIGEIFNTLVLGFFFEEDNPLYLVLKGGGLISMWKTCLIVFISCALSGIIQMLKILVKVEDLILKSKNIFQLYLYTIGLSVISSMVGCNQSIAVVMTADIMKRIYERKGLTKEYFAIDIENSCILIPAIIPWNIAGLMPATIMELPNLAYIKYIYFIYSVPIFMLFYKFIIKKKVKFLN